MRAKASASFTKPNHYVILKLKEGANIMILKGKNILFLGSSVTYGSAAGGVSFADTMAEICEFNYVKEAVSGTTLADINEKSYVSRLRNINKNNRFDLFICQLSTNDAAHNRNIDFQQTEDAIRYILSYVKETFGCPIVFYTGTRFENKKYLDMINLLYRLKNEYDFYILDLYNSDDMNAISVQDYKRYMADSIHPNAVGYREWWTPKFIAFCEQLPY